MKYFRYPQEHRDIYLLRFLDITPEQFMRHRECILRIAGRNVKKNRVDLAQCMRDIRAIRSSARLSSVSSSGPGRLYFLVGRTEGTKWVHAHILGDATYPRVSRSCVNKSRLAGILLNAPTFRRAINPTVESTMHFASVESNPRPERVDANRPPYRSSRAKQLSVALHASPRFRGFFPGYECGCGMPFLRPTLGTSLPYANPDAGTDHVRVRKSESDCGK